MIRVLVVDDHPVVADGVVSALGSAGFEVVGRASDLDRAVAQIRAQRPDVVVCDVMLGSSPVGLDLPARLQDEGIEVSGLVYLSSYDAPYFRARAVRSGANEYLLKSASTEAIAAAVATAADGRVAISAAEIRLAASYRSPTVRESQIIAMLSEGLANSEVGKRLGISQKTVESHLRNLFRRFGVSSRTELVTLARQQGWLSGGH